MNFLGTLCGRAGYVMRPQTLIHGTAGLAFGKVDFSDAQPGSDRDFDFGVVPVLSVLTGQQPQKQRAPAGAL